MYVRHETVFLFGQGGCWKELVPPLVYVEDSVKILVAAFEEYDNIAYDNVAIFSPN